MQTAIATAAPTYTSTHDPHTDSVVQAERASSVQSELDNVSNASRGTLRSVLTGLARVGLGIRDAFVRIGNALTCCFRTAVDVDELSRSSAACTPIPVSEALNSFAALSDDFAAIVADPPAGQAASPLDGKAYELFYALSANLQTLINPARISDHQLSAPLLARLAELERSPVVDGMTCEQLIAEIWGGRNDILSSTVARSQLRSYLDHVRTLLIALAEEVALGGGAFEQVDRMRSLYPDHRVIDVVAKLGMKVVGGGGEYARLNKDPCYHELGTNDVGARFRNKTNVHTRVRLEGGKVYAGGNEVVVGEMKAIVCSYPRARDLPDYIAMLAQKAGIVNVLMATEEIKSKNNTDPNDFPMYFAQNGQYGDYQVVSTPKGSCKAGSLHVDMYDITIMKKGEAMSDTVRINHVTDWNDFTGCDSQSLRELTQLARSTAPNFVPVIHCRGGLGRAGTTAAALAVTAGMPAMEAISALRAARSPEMVQTVDQVRTLVNIERQCEAGRQQAGPDPIYVNTAFQAGEM
jgi:protein-tyrosine phosphatase